MIDVADEVFGQGAFAADGGGENSSTGRRRGEELFKHGFVAAVVANTENEVWNNFLFP